MTWPAKRSAYEPLLQQWTADSPLVHLDTVHQYDGGSCYAVTVGRLDRPRLLFAVPHAHEPAGTVACLDFICQLVTGRNLEGEATALHRDAALDRFALTFIPDANPAGRERAPEDVWDGTKLTNNAFLDIAFGTLRGGQRFPRPGRWCDEEYSLERLGIVWEQIDRMTYVEPNRDLDSSLCRLVARALQAAPCRAMLHLHQTELENSPRDCFAILPVMFEDLPADLQQANEAWAKALIAAWQAVGGNPIPEPTHLGYGEDQLRLFRAAWAHVHQSMPTITVEVQNNNTRTPPAKQLLLSGTAIRATVDHLLAS